MPRTRSCGNCTVVVRAVATLMVPGQRNGRLRLTDRPADVNLVHQHGFRCSDSARGGQQVPRPVTRSRLFFMYLMFVDESGDLAPLPLGDSTAQPVLVLVGLIVPQSRLAAITREWTALKRRFFPPSVTRRLPSIGIEQRSRARICGGCSEFPRRAKNEGTRSDSSTSASHSLRSTDADTRPDSGSKSQANRSTAPPATPSRCRRCAVTFKGNSTSTMRSVW